MKKYTEREILEELFRVKKDFPDAELRVFNNKEMGEKFPCQECGAKTGRDIQIQVDNDDYNFFIRFCMECGFDESGAKWGGYYKMEESKGE